MTAIIEEDPGDLIHRWLLNIAYMTLGECPEKVPPRWRVPEEAFLSEYDIKRFGDAASALGLDVQGLSGGSFLDDFNGDGRLDVTASSSGLSDQLRYVENRGDGAFTKRTNGHSDVFVLRGAWLGPHRHHPNSLLRNNRDGTFADVTEQAGVLSFRPTQTATWADHDNDGWLDLLVAGYHTTSLGDIGALHLGLPERAEKPRLYRNNRDGTFADVTSQTRLDRVILVGGWPTPPN